MKQLPPALRFNLQFDAANYPTVTVSDFLRFLCVAAFVADRMSRPGNNRRAKRSRYLPMIRVDIATRRGFARDRERPD